MIQELRRTRTPPLLGRVMHAEASADLNMQQLQRALENRVDVMNGRVRALEDERDANRAEAVMLRRQMEQLPLAVAKAFERMMGRIAELEHKVQLMEGNL